jgi:hypothetical protein
MRGVRSFDGVGIIGGEMASKVRLRDGGGESSMGLSGGCMVQTALRVVSDCRMMSLWVLLEV